MTTESQLSQAEREALEDERRIALYPDEPELHDIIRKAKYDHEVSANFVSELVETIEASLEQGNVYYEIDEDTDEVRPLPPEECRRIDQVTRDLIDQGGL